MDPTLDGDEVEAVLREEYKLLCLCDHFKEKFDEYAESEGVSRIPSTFLVLSQTHHWVTSPFQSTEFYFNFKGAVFGQLMGGKSSDNHILSHKFFLATPLLPCGDLDAPIRKFTGNDEFGDPEDALTMAVQAFAHFSLVYSHDYLIFCDLQGSIGH